MTPITFVRNRGKEGICPLCHQMDDIKICKRDLEIAIKCEVEAFEAATGLRVESVDLARFPPVYGSENKRPLIDVKAQVKV